MLPTHIFAPGAQTPMQVPATHMLLHAGPRCQTPFASHVSGMLSSQRRSPGMQAIASCPESDSPSFPVDASGLETLPAAPPRPPTPVVPPPPLPVTPAAPVVPPTLI